MLGVTRRCAELCLGPSQGDGGLNEAGDVGRCDGVWHSPEMTHPRVGGQHKLVGGVLDFYPRVC